MAAPKGLGKGLGSLIPENFDPSLLMDSKERVQNVLIESVQPNPEQPRRHFEEAALEELASSIKRYGILQPLIVSPAGSSYILVAGERRWRAATKAGLQKVPVIVRERQELERLEIALIENVQRVDLSPMEQAISIEKLHTQFNISYQEIAQRLGKAVPTINNTVRLLQLPPTAIEALQKQQITEGHARAVLALKAEPAKQAELLRAIIEKGWSVRQAEQFVTETRGPVKKTAAAQAKIHTTPETEALSHRLATKVSLHQTAKGGRLELHFKDEADLARLLELLAKLR